MCNRWRIWRWVWNAQEGFFEAFCVSAFAFEDEAHRAFDAVSVPSGSVEIVELWHDGEKVRAKNANGEVEVF